MNFMYYVRMENALYNNGVTIFKLALNLKCIVCVLPRTTVLLAEVLLRAIGEHSYYYLDPDYLAFTETNQKHGPFGSSIAEFTDIVLRRYL